jgi:LysM repeat protein
MIETGYETMRVNVDNLKKQVQDLTQSETRVEQENADLKTQLAALQDELKHEDEVHAQEQKELLAQVAEVISSSLSKTKTHGHAPRPEASPTPQIVADEPVTDPQSETSNVTKPHLMDNPPDPTLVGSGDPSTKPSPVPVETPVVTPHSVVEHGYNHIVAEGETLAKIAHEYRAQGVKVTVADICKANNLSAQVVLKPGQKLFIPKL